MAEKTTRPECELCGSPAAYLINSVLYFCKDCRDAIDEEFSDAITVEEIDDDDDERED